MERENLELIQRIIMLLRDPEKSCENRSNLGVLLNAHKFLSGVKEIPDVLFIGQPVSNTAANIISPT
jgi:hypothetical protein